ncbi:putative zinc finger protein [Plasmodium yoelii yoelii]|uniref:Zinc finger protein n=1 Tax=Plasmodium yoelii yoelii TaxID=73239 RepID=Q7RNF0_PLAYO|nr:putative zinc finger protein [Plasmodium yoelii yoelii]
MLLIFTVLFFYLGKEICINCQNCFIKLEFRYEEFTFDETFTANDAAIKKIDDMINKLFTSKTNKKKIVTPQSNNLKIEKTKNVVKINNIEVKDGACKHYKKSHKLFKFPCCNKIFPCPTCHNLNSNHEYVLARRVICGYCYREFDDDDVCICQKDKKPKKGGNFWEGGKGCRNAITLSKNDSKKYKLLNRQTVQKKKK